MGCIFPFLNLRVKQLSSKRGKSIIVESSNVLSRITPSIRIRDLWFEITVRASYSVIYLENEACATGRDDTVTLGIIITLFISARRELINFSTETNARQ